MFKKKSMRTARKLTTSNAKKITAHTSPRGISEKRTRQPIKRNKLMKKSQTEILYQTKNLL